MQLETTLKFSVKRKREKSSQAVFFFWLEQARWCIIITLVIVRCDGSIKYNPPRKSILNTWSKVHWLSSIPSLESSRLNAFCSSKKAPKVHSLVHFSSLIHHDHFTKDSPSFLTSVPERNPDLQHCTFNKTLPLSFHLFSYSDSNAIISIHLLLILKTRPSPLSCVWNLFLKHNISSLTSSPGYVFSYISH